MIAMNQLFCYLILKVWKPTLILESTIFLTFKLALWDFCYCQSRHIQYCICLNVFSVKNPKQLITHPLLLHTHIHLLFWSLMLLATLLAQTCLLQWTRTAAFLVAMCVYVSMQLQEKERGRRGDMGAMFPIMLLNLFCTLEVNAEQLILTCISTQMFLSQKALNWTQRTVCWERHLCWQSLNFWRLSVVQTSCLMLPHSVLSSEPASYSLIRRLKKIRGIESAQAAAAVCGCSWVELWKVL